MDPLRRIGLKELKQRIQQCKYFTRTAEVDRWERLQDLTISTTSSLSSSSSSSLFDPIPYNNKSTRPPSPPLNQTIKLPPIQQHHHYQYHHHQQQHTYNNKPSVATTTTTTPIHVDLPPSPPSTPRDRSQQSLTGDMCFNDQPLLSPIDPNTSGHLISLML